MTNKHIFRIVPLLAALLWGMTAGAQQTPGLLHFNNVAELQTFLQYSPGHMPLISAHRGGPQKGFPENCLETFQNSIRFEPLLIECDIALTKDSALVMMHDDRLDRTSTGTGPIGNYTLEQLKDVRLKDNDGNVTEFHIPLLDEILNWGKGKVIFTLDLKRNVPYAMVIEAVRRCKAEASSVIITYNANQVAEVYHLAPDLMISASIQRREDLDRLHALGIPDNRLVAFTGTHEAPDSVYALLHEHKILSLLGTMGNLDNQAIAKGDSMYAAYINHGADILSTNRPVEAGAVVQEYIRQHHLRSEHLSYPRRENNRIADTDQKVVPGRTNSVANEKKPYVVLISLDGFRYDYADKYHAEHLLGFAHQGVRAVSMIPSYPSLTFPNHYAIVTGLYPAHHGLVGNSFYDPAKDASYSMGDKAKVGDSSWYGGTPLWVLAEQQQLISASMFWVGSEAAVKGVRPTYYYKYSEQIDISTRIQAVKDWLQLPEDKRPHFITFYLSEPDHSGHSFGPDAPQTEAAVHMVDSVVNRLVEAVNSTGLPVNFIVVSDHGMTAVDRDHPIVTPAAIDRDKFVIPTSGTMLTLYAKNKADIQPAYEALKKEENNDYKVYLKKDVPAALHYGQADDRMNRLPDILLLPKWPRVFSDRKPGVGYHGFEPMVVKDMHATFIAWGPAFKKGVTIPSFENVHVYPLVTKLLGLSYTEQIDGRKEVLSGILK